MNISQWVAQWSDAELEILASLAAFEIGNPIRVAIIARISEQPEDRVTDFIEKLQAYQSAEAPYITATSRWTIPDELTRAEPDSPLSAAATAVLDCYTLGGKNITAATVLNLVNSRYHDGQRYQFTHGEITAGLEELAGQNIIPSPLTDANSYQLGKGFAELMATATTILQLEMDTASEIDTSAAQEAKRLARETKKSGAGK